MKNFLIILFFFLSGCTSKKISLLPVWDFEKSNNISPRLFNEKIILAYDKHMSWVQNPETYIFHLYSFEELKTFTYKYEVDDTETPSKIDIYLIRDGFLDDSVRGDFIHLELIKDTNVWKILSIKESYSCWQQKELIYQSAPCP